MSPCEIVQSLMPEISAASELKVLLAIASATAEGKAAELSLTDLMRLTGLSKQGVVNGIDLGSKRGVLKRRGEKNSFAYWLESSKDIDRNGQQNRPLLVNNVDRLDDKSSHGLDRLGKPIHIPDLKEDEEEEVYVSSEADALSIMQGKGSLRQHEIASTSHLRRLIGYENFKHPQVQGSWRSWYENQSPERIAQTWREAFDQNDVAPLFWFVDRLNGKRLSKQVQRDQPETVAPGRALPPLSPGDEARTPDGLTHVVLDVCSNGMVVFEDDAPPIHWRGLQMASGQGLHA